MTPAPASGQRRQVAASMNQNSRRSSPRLTAKGWATAVIPRISPRFAALLPITFPTARPGAFPQHRDQTRPPIFRRPKSRRRPPSAPITSGLMRKRRANLTDPSTSQSAPYASPASPTAAKTQARRDKQERRAGHATGGAGGPSPEAATVRKAPAPREGSRRRAGARRSAPPGCPKRKGKTPSDRRREVLPGPDSRCGFGFPPFSPRTGFPPFCGKCGKPRLTGGAGRTAGGGVVPEG